MIETAFFQFGQIWIFVAEMMVTSRVSEVAVQIFSQVVALTLLNKKISTPVPEQPQAGM